MALTTNLVSYYKLDGDSTDAAGTGNNGTDTSVSYGSGFGKIGQGASFSGTSYIRVPYASSLNFSGGLSIAAWVQTSSFSSPNNLPSYISTKMKGATWASDLEWCFRWNDTNDIQFVVNTSGGQLNLETTGLGLSPNTWYHMVATWDGSTGAAVTYLNAVSKVTGTQAGALLTGSFDMEMGGNSFASEYHPCFLDEVGIWSRALTSTEITSLYNGGAGLTYPFVIDAADQATYATKPMPNFVSRRENTVTVIK